MRIRVVAGAALDRLAAALKLPGVNILVQAGQRPFRNVMIEWLDLAPRTHAVTGLAQFLAALQTGFENIRILPMVRVLMTPLTRPVRKVVLTVGIRRSRFLAMTILTRHRRVRPI